MFRKNKLAMIVGEFTGAFVLTLAYLALSHSQLALNYFIESAAAVAMGVLVVALSGISGAVFNPAVTIGLWTVRKLRTLQALAYIAVQLLGGIVAWELFVYFTKLNTVHNTGTYTARAMVAEIVGTGILTFAWASAIYQRMNVYAKAVTIAGGLAVGGFVASLGSAGLLNPSVALGLRQWGWGTYVLGPVLGAVIGFNLYNLLFVETELAEVAGTKAEKAQTSKLNATLTESEVANVAAANAKSATAKGRTAATKRKTTAAKKTTAKRSTSSRRKNPNAA
jgi:glycerol uptake facilitator-like aquaporin